LPEAVLQEITNLDGCSMDGIGTGTVIANDVVEFPVSIDVHPIDKVMAVVPAPMNMEPPHFRDTVTDCSNQAVLPRESRHILDLSMIISP
jgi:hypothetical protein